MPVWPRQVLEERWQAFHVKKESPFVLRALARDVTEAVRAEEELRATFRSALAFCRTRSGVELPGTCTTHRPRPRRFGKPLSATDALIPRPAGNHASRLAMPGLADQCIRDVRTLPIYCTRRCWISGLRMRFVLRRRLHGTDWNRS